MEFTMLFPCSLYLPFPLRLLRKCILRSILFSLLFRTSLSSSEFFTMERCCDDICLVVICSDLLNNLVYWSYSPYLLCEFLKSWLRIYEEWLFENMRKCRIDMFNDKFFGNLKSLIEIECSDDCLKGIRENIWILMSFGIVFSTRHLDPIREVEMMSNLGEIATSHECWADIREFSFWFFWKTMKECLSDHEFENRITEILKSLIGLCIAICCLIEHGSMNTRECVEVWIFWNDIEWIEECGNLLLKFWTSKADRDTRHRG